MLLRGRLRKSLRPLVAFSLMADYLYRLNGPAAGDSAPLHDLGDALQRPVRQPGAAQQRPWDADGGYLRALLRTCDIA